MTISDPFALSPIPAGGPDSRAAEPDPAPAALSVWRVPRAALTIDRPWPALGRAAFAKLLDCAGRVVDEVVVECPIEAPDEVILMGHGGPGLHQAVRRIRADGGATALPEPDAQWRSLAACVHAAAVTWRLGHPVPALPPWPEAWLYRPLRVLITGPPNAGKSTLLNAWCGHARALVSPVAGTTRDLLDVVVEHRGWRLRLTDSAGLRVTDDPLEQAGQALVEAARATADLVLCLVPADGPDPDVIPDGALVIRSRADLGPVHSEDLAFSDRDAVEDRLRDIGDAVLARLGLR